MVGWDVDFPDACAGYEYRFLMSFGGVGPTDVFGLNVPLSYGPMFARTYAGLYPAAFLHAQPTGVLDADGRAFFGGALAPDQFPWRMGFTVYVACLAFPVGDIQPAYSTECRTLQMLP